MTGDATYVAGILPGKRTIVTIHDLGFLNQQKGFKYLLLKWLYIRIPVKKACAVTTISEETKREIVSYTRCNPEKIKVIPNPVDTLIKYVSKAFNQSKPKLLFLGSTPNKNLDRAIEAIKDFPCKLWIVGQPNEQQQLLLKEYRIDYHIERGLSDQEIADRYAQSDIIFFPTLYEGFGLPVVEAMSAGCPVITYNNSSMPEVAGSAALYTDGYGSYPIYEALTKLLEDTKLADRLRKRGTAQAKKFDWDVSVKAVWDEILKFTT